MFENKKIHMIGIGGISMSSIALMLLQMNSKVTGSDTQESDITKMLIEKGIDIKYGHHPEMIKDADMIIWTAAINENDPEREEARKLNKIGFERAEALGIISKSYKNCLCISGTHGKSTTTGMLGNIFLKANLNPTIQVGALLKEINGNTHIGTKDYLIMEACEYVDSFLHFHPTGIIVTNVDNDHLDYFKNLDNIKKSFTKYVGLLPENGIFVKNNDDANSKDIDSKTSATVITYGINNHSDYMAKHINIDDLGHYSFDIYKDDNKLTTINLSINGRHNVYNALAAFALAHHYINDINAIKEGLEAYHGVGRRFEYLGKVNDAFVFDDYAHHPSEIKTTLDSVKSTKHNKSWAIFQSHTYSRTFDHLDAFADILSNFDNIIIATIYPAREINTYGVSEEQLVDLIRKKNPNVQYIDSFEKIEKFIKENVEPNDLVITIGAGPINKVANNLVKNIV